MENINSTRYIPFHLLHRAVADIMCAAGMPAADATAVADCLVAADMSGRFTHGSAQLPMYVRAIEEGGINPTAEITRIMDYPASAVLDANNAMGVVAAKKAIMLAINKASVCGIGAVSVRNSNHFAIAGYHASIAAQEGMIGIAMTNGPKAVTPWGGCEKFFGTNPLAVAVPTGKENIVLDIASSVAAHGKVVAASKAGQPIPEGWGLSPSGMATTSADEALEGCLLPFGGHKGSGLSLIIDILSGVLSGSAYGPHVESPQRKPWLPMHAGHFFAAIDISKFMDPASFNDLMSSYRRELKLINKADGFAEIFLPGDRSSVFREKCLADGIPLSESTLGKLRALAQQYSINVDLT